jgi:hypothetical protein
MSRPVLLAAALLLATSLPAAAQSISLSLQDGRVTLITQNATPAAILAEWARQGQVRVVDAERVPGTPLTLRLENVPEREALDIVLRGAAGYIAAPRAQQVAANVSRFDRVIVMASSPGASAARAATPAATARQAPPAAVQPPMVEEDAPQEGAQAGVVEDAPVAAPEQPASSTNFDYANPQRYFAARQAEQAAAEAAVGAQPDQEAQPAPSPTSPLGAGGATRATPGMLPTPPPQTGPGGAGAGAAPMNPYGLPAGQTPGSSQAPPPEPDRAKYINPYSPTPPKP